MPFKKVYILLFFVLFTSMVFANTAKDTLQVDTNTVLVKADFRENFKEHYDSDKFIYEIFGKF